MLVRNFRPATGVKPAARTGFVNRSDALQYDDASQQVIAELLLKLRCGFLISFKADGRERNSFGLIKLFQAIDKRAALHESRRLAKYARRWRGSRQLRLG